MKLNKLSSLLCVISSVAILNTGLVGAATGKTEEADISVTFEQPNTLSVTLSSNTVDFGEVTGLDEVEKAGAITATVSSSLPYDIDAKAVTDIVGTTNPSSTIEVDKISIKVDSEAYTALATDKSYVNLLSSSPAGLDVAHTLDFKLASTIGADSDDYSVPLKLKVAQK